VSGGLESATIRDAAALAALVPEWWTLWRDCPAATPFQSPAWLLPWWQSFAPGELHVVTVQENGRLVGLAPLYLETGARWDGVIIRRLLPIGIPITDYHDVLLAPDRLNEASAALAGELARSPDWESCELPELAEHAQAPTLPSPPGCEDRLEVADTCPFVALPDETAQLSASLPARKRRSLAMNRNRAKRRGAVAFLSLADTAPEWLLGEFIRLHGLRWESRGESGALADPRVQDFHRRALPRLASAGLARLYALTIGGDVAAVYYGFLHDGHALAYLSGLDPAFAHESPGTLLIAHAMEEAIREGAREFHFLRGDEAYKYGWGAVDRYNRRRTFTRRQADAAA
jgi:CelD/BcsL family acetyltransferase involved in cellulose biosynthesis